MRESEFFGAGFGSVVCVSVCVLADGLEVVAPLGSSGFFCFAFWFLLLLLFHF